MYVVMSARDRTEYRPLLFRLGFNDIEEVLHRIVALFDMGSEKLALRTVA